MKGGGADLALPIEFLIDEVNEKVDVDFGTSKDFHNGHTFILHLKQILKNFFLNLTIQQHNFTAIIQ